MGFARPIASMASLAAAALQGVSLKSLVADNYEETMRALNEFRNKHMRYREDMRGISRRFSINFNQPHQGAREIARRYAYNLKHGIPFYEWEPHPSGPGKSFNRGPIRRKQALIRKAEKKLWKMSYARATRKALKEGKRVSPMARKLVGAPA